MCVAQPVPSAAPVNACPDLQQEIEGVVVTLEHLAVQAAYTQEPCAQILLRTAELLRVVVLSR